MRTKNAKRFWPVPATVVALAAFLAFGMMATTGAQPAAAQEDPCFTADTIVSGGDNTSGAQICSVTGASATVKFVGNTGADTDGEAPTMYRVYYPISANEDITLYPAGTIYLVNEDHDIDDVGLGLKQDGTPATRNVTGYYSGPADVNSPPTPVSPTKFAYKLVSLAGALDGPSGLKPQSDTIMVSGSAGDKKVVYAFRSTVMLAEVDERPIGSTAEMFPSLPTNATALTITFLGSAVLTAPDGDDEDKKPDERSSLKAYAASIETAVDGGVTRTADDPSVGRLVTKVITAADDPMSVYFTATIRDIKNNVLGDDDAEGDARVVFTVMYAAGSDLRSNPISPQTADVDTFGQAEINVNNWKGGAKAVQLTVGAVYQATDGTTLNLGEVTVSRTGPADSITAGIYDFDDCVDTMENNIGATSDLTDDMINIEATGCAEADPARFGEGNMFILAIEVTDNLGSVIDDTETDVEFDDEVVSRVMYGTANGDSTATPAVPNMPFYVYTVEKDAALAPSMLTVSHDSDDVDDVPLTITVAGPPTQYMFVDPADNIELGGRATFTLQAYDANDGVPHFITTVGDDDKNDTVEIVVPDIAESLVRGSKLTAGILTLGSDTGMGTFTIYAPSNAVGGSTARIFVSAGDVEITHTVTFGAATPGEGEMVELMMPTGVRANPFLGLVNVEWTAGQGAHGHAVLLFNAADNAFVDGDFLNDPTVTDHTFKGVASGDYYVIVAAYQNKDEGGRDYEYDFLGTDVTVR